MLHIRNVEIAIAPLRRCKKSLSKKSLPCVQMLPISKSVQILSKCLLKQCEMICKQLMASIEGVHILNHLDSKQLPQDIMHTSLEETVQYEVRLVLLHFIQNGDITL